MLSLRRIRLTPPDGTDPPANGPLSGDASMHKAMLALALSLTVAVVPLCWAEDAAKEFLPADLSGWEGLPSCWTYKDGVLTGKTPEGQKTSPHTFLCSKKKYKDFELKLKVRLTDGKGNSGIQIRSKIADAKQLTVAGPQADMATGYWGSLYGEKFGGMMKAASKEGQAAAKPKDFNDYTIKVVGKHVTLTVNGTVTVDEDFAKLPEEGIIAFQLHAGPPMEVTFKDIEFKDLSAK
jgi:Domain of Unknown Function (DUF1080)